MTRAAASQDESFFLSYVKHGLSFCPILKGGIVKLPKKHV